MGKKWGRAHQRGQKTGKATVRSGGPQTREITERGIRGEMQSVGVNLLSFGWRIAF